MATTPATGARTVDGTARPSRLRRLTTETKQAFKTTEFYAYLAVLVGVLVAGSMIDSGDGATDVFRADEVWLYATILTVGYAISRGLAKAGSYERDDEDRDRR